MASQMYTSLAYLIPRVGLWLLLFILALIDGIKHRYENSRARKLYAAVVVVLGAVVLQDVLLLLSSLLKADAVFAVFIFFTDLADSLFMALMLTIAAGFCITRESLGPYKTKVTAIPCVYFLTVLFVDFTMFEVRGKSAFDIVHEPQQPTVRGRMSEWQSTLLLVATILNLFALLGAIIYVFDTVAKERQMLEQPENDVYGIRDMESGGTGLPPASEGAGQRGDGHAVVPPIEAAVDNNGELPNTYGEVTVEDLDGSKTVEEKVARHAKIRLLKQFSFGVAFYALSTFAVIIVPVFIAPNVPGETVMRVVLILQNVVYWLFMLGLAYIFRLRGDSPYLMVGEEESSSPEDDHNNLRTELGVLDGDSGSESGQRRHSGGSMDNFSLHDLDDGHDVEDGGPVAASTASQPADRKAFREDPAAEAPKSGLLKNLPRSDAP